MAEVRGEEKNLHCLYYTFLPILQNMMSSLELTALEREGVIKN